MESHSVPELIYFNGRGYGEIIRLVLAASGTEVRTMQAATAVRVNLPVILGTLLLICTRETPFLFISANALKH
jgi:hypothetical protein